MDLSDMRSDLSSSQTIDENSNSLRFVPGSPLSSNSVMQSNNSFQQDLATLFKDSINQLKIVTLPNDTKQMQFLESLNSSESQTNIKNQLSSLLDFLIEKVTSSSLETTKMFKEMQAAREEAKISEAKSSRMLLHLQQNVKLLTKLATDNGETTLAQEAAQNVQSISQIEDATVPHDYIRTLKQTLANKTDPTARIEVLELLKQEIAINSIMRRQAQSLTEKSNLLTKTVEEIKANFANASSKNIGIFRQKVKKYKQFIKQLCELYQCDEKSIITTITNSIDKLKSNQSAIDALNQKLNQLKIESQTQIQKLTEENSKLMNENKSYKNQLSSSQKNIKKVKNKFYELYNIPENQNETDLDGLLSISNRAIQSLSSYFNIQKSLGMDISKITIYINNLKDEIAKLKIDQEKKRVLMEKQAETIAELKDKSWKSWGIDNIQDIPHQSEYESYSSTSLISKSTTPSKFINQSKDQQLTNEHTTQLSSEFWYGEDTDESQFEQFNLLKNQFNSIQQELDKLKENVDLINGANDK